MTAGTIDRLRTPAAAPVETEVRPVMLLTFNVPFSKAAISVAIDAAAETRAELVVCDAMSIAPSYVAHAARQWAEQDNREHARVVAREAQARGVRVKLVGFHNPKPVQAALEVCRDFAVGLLVLGPERNRLGRFSYGRIKRRVRRDAPCLLWVED